MCQAKHHISTRFRGYIFLRFLLLVGSIVLLNPQALFSQATLQLPYTIDSDGIEDLSTNSSWSNTPIDYSGITYSSSTATLFIVDNNKNDIYEYSTSGTPQNQFELPSTITDAEGIAWMYSNRFAVADEDSSNIYIVELNSGQAALIYTIPSPVPVDGSYGLEGVSIAPTTAAADTLSIFVVKEGDKESESESDKPKLYGFEYDIDTEISTTLFAPYNLSGQMADASDLYYEATENAVYVVSDESKKIVKYNLTSTGPKYSYEELALTNLLNNPSPLLNDSFSQPEGITFLPNLAELFVVGEARELGHFTQNNQCPTMDGYIGDHLYYIGGDEVSLWPSAIEPDGDPLTWSATGLPPELTIETVSTNDNTGHIYGTQTNIGVYTVTVTVSEINNPACSDSEEFVLTFATPPNYPPVITPMADQSDYIGENSGFYSISLDNATATDPNNDPLDWAVAGLPAGMSYAPAVADDTTLEFSGSPSSAGVYPITLTVTDSGGLSDTETFTLTVTLNAAPTFAQLPNLSHEENQSLPTNGIMLGATDGDAGTPYQLVQVMHSASSLPPGLSLDDGTGVVTGTPTQVGTYNIRLVANDGINGPILSNWFTWEITTPNTCPTMEGYIGDHLYYIGGDEVSLWPSAIEPDGDPLTWNATGLPPELTIETVSTNDNTGHIYGTQTNTGVYTVTVTVSEINDPTCSDSDEFILTIAMPPNYPPTWNFIPSSRVAIVGYDLTAGIPFTASDPNNDPLTYSASGLPDGLTIDTTTGYVAGIPTTVGIYNSTITVSDGLAEITQSFVWATIPVDICPTIASGADNRSDMLGDNISEQLTAIDPEGNTLWWDDDDTLPPGITLNNLTGVMSGSPTAVGTFSVTIRVWESGAPGNQCMADEADSKNFTWTVTSNSVPKLMPVEDQFNTVGDQGIVIKLEARDADGDRLTWTANGLPRGLELSPANDEGSVAVIRGMVRTSGEYKPVITVSDGNGGEDSISFKWRIKSNSAPELMPVEDQFNTVGDQGIVIKLEARDADGDRLTWTASGLPRGLELSPANDEGSVAVIRGMVRTGGEYKPVITVSDGNGGEDSISFKLVIRERRPLPQIHDAELGDNSVGVYLPIITQK